MPNSQNRSKDQSNIVKPKRRSTKANAPNPKEESDKQQGNSSKGKESSGESPKQGS